jgi:agmatine deiminase
MASPIFIPADWNPHECCWMAWAVDPRDWDSVTKVKDELSEVIQTIAQFEPVRVLAHPGVALREARREFAACSDVTVREAPVSDIWMRDIAPTFGLRGDESQKEVVAIDWNFNSWGNTPMRPRRRGDELAQNASSVFGTPRISVPFVAEGGALVTDGRGTLITTRSCLLNQNRNPPQSGVDRERLIEFEFAKFGIRKVVWLEGDGDEQLTNGHADGYVLCAPEGLVMVETIEDKRNAPLWRNHDITILKSARDPDGRKFKVVPVRAPSYDRDAKSELFAPCYLNVYVANKGVVGARFDDVEKDAAAKLAIEAAFPGRDVRMLRIDHIADGGGGVHCLTQSMPALKADDNESPHNAA